MNSKLLTMAALAAPLFSAGFASNALAAIQMQLSSGGSSTTITGAGGIVSRDRGAVEHQYTEWCQPWAGDHEHRPQLDQRDLHRWRSATGH